MSAEERTAHQTLITREVSSSATDGPGGRSRQSVKSGRLANRKRRWSKRQGSARLGVLGAVLFVIIITAVAQTTYAATMPPDFVDSVVVLGTDQLIQQSGQPPVTQWETEGTGFICGYLLKNDPNLTTRRYLIYLVTAKHVGRNTLERKHQILPSETFELE